MRCNAQLAGVRLPVMTSTNLAKLPNYHNSIYEALRSEDKKQELQKYQKGNEEAEWAASGQVPQTSAEKHFGA